MTGPLEMGRDPRLETAKMSTRKHVHEEIFPASVERLFTLLHTPSAIRRWWGAAHAIVVPETGGTWAAVWGEAEDDPDYIAAREAAERGEG